MARRGVKVGSRARSAYLAGIAFLSPLAGAVIGHVLPVSLLPVGFWRGLILQLCLAATPVAFVALDGRWSAAGFARAGARRSLVWGAAYSAVYLALVLGASAFGVRTPHFDEARRILGLPAVLALYIPFWGLLEGVWIALFLYALDGLLGGGARARAVPPKGPGWAAILVGGLGFGLAHSWVQAVLYGQPIFAALGYIAVGVVFVVAATIVRATGSAWGLLLFWTISNF
ncbi:MAG: hypothetical protein IRZ11_09250 [Clostridia bacterium]|nr:hypothetical protein [Clostridia bacterium]